METRLTEVEEQVQNLRDQVLTLSRKLNRVDRKATGKKSGRGVVLDITVEELQNHIQQLAEKSSLTDRYLRYHEYLPVEEVPKWQVEEQVTAKKEITKLANRHRLATKLPYTAEQLAAMPIKDLVSVMGLVGSNPFNCKPANRIKEVLGLQDAFDFEKWEKSVFEVEWEEEEDEDEDEEES